MALFGHSWPESARITPTDCNPDVHCRSGTCSLSHHAGLQHCPSRLLRCHFNVLRFCGTSLIWLLELLSGHAERHHEGAMLAGCPICWSRRSSGCCRSRIARDPSKCRSRLTLQRHAPATPRDTCATRRQGTKEGLMEGLEREPQAGNRNPAQVHVRN
jgi:hypothetical protein